MIGIGIIFAALAFEASVQEAKVETECLQEGLTNRCSLVQYSSLVRMSGGNAVWTDALQTALREHEVVVIPASGKPYDIDRTIVVPSNRRIEAKGATIRATRDLYTVLFRNEHVADGTLRPIPPGTRDRNIAFVGGRFEDWCRRRSQNNRANRNHVDGTDCKVGNYLGAGALLFFSNCDNLMLKGVTIARAGNFAVQSGDGRAHVYEDITFDRCYADGLHLNGNLSDVLVRNVRGQVGDDLVALNAYDWLWSSVSFGPQRNIVCEDLRLIQTRRFHAYPALRIQPAKFRYADGSIVDCSVSNIVFRKVRGIMNFKGYLQTPPYKIGEKPEWSAVGSGGNWHFEDIEIDLTGPVAWCPDPQRGHYGAFELCADLTGVHLDDIRIRFRTDKYPLAHLVVVGPKSCVSNRQGGTFEIFDPYASCTVKDLTLGKIATSGRVPGELVWTTAFNDINRDGQSSGRGVIVGPTGAGQGAGNGVLTDGSTPWKIRFADAGSYDLRGWQRRALSFGNGYMGVSEFGDVATEKLQLSDPTFHTRQQEGGGVRGNFTDAADLFFEFGHSDAVGYARELDLETAIVAMKYDAGGVNYTREHFASYPDRVGVAHFTADRKGALSFTVKPLVPFLGAKAPGDRTGDVRAEGDSVHMRQTGCAYGVRLAGEFKVLGDGRVTAGNDGTLKVEGASEATVIYALATNYRLGPEMFDCRDAQQGAEIAKRRLAAFGPDPEPEARRRVEAAAALGYARLKARHLADFRALYGRSDLRLVCDPADFTLPTPELRAKRAGDSVYLQALYWRYGKFLLVCSSRPGTLPGSLQGCWAGPVPATAWGSGFWHNINVQMDYWPAFSCNLAECFQAYAAFNAAFRPVTRAAGEAFLRRVNPHGLDTPPCEDFWSVDTAVWPYELYGAPGSHSGPGTGGFTTALYTDWYDFTQDRDALERHCWPVLRGMADMLSRSVTLTGGHWLAAFSASPEVRYRRRYYHTVGCAFDQEMIQENNAAFVRFAKILGREDDPVVRRCREQLGKYDPVQVGADGQIKEFREETHYNDFCGERHHRHISHLVGLYPGAIINRTTPEWLKAASRTLDLRGDHTEAWALVHRMCCRARLGEGDRAAVLFGNLMREKTADTLWSVSHGVHLVDANYAGTAAFTEMLVQSHERDEKGNFIVDLLPALPAAWRREGAFSGLCVRGGWTIDCTWKDGRPVKVELHPGPHAGPRPLVRFGTDPLSV